MRNRWPISGTRGSSSMEFACPANQHLKSTIVKKSPQTFAHLVNLSAMSAMFDNNTILLFRLQNKQTFRMFCVSCSVHGISTYDARKGSWAFYLNYPQISEVGQSAHKACMEMQHSLSPVSKKYLFL